MAASKSLSKRQTDFLDDMVESGPGLQELLQRNALTPAQFLRWLGSERFQSRLADRARSEFMHARAILSHHAVTAVATLVALTSSEKTETARKACLDIIELARSELPSEGSPTAPEPKLVRFAPGEASDLLAELAGAQRDREEGD